MKLGTLDTHTYLRFPRYMFHLQLFLMGRNCSSPLLQPTPCSLYIHSYTWIVVLVYPDCQLFKLLLALVNITFQEVGTATFRIPFPEVPCALTSPLYSSKGSWPQSRYYCVQLEWTMLDTCIACTYALHKSVLYRQNTDTFFNRKGDSLHQVIEAIQARSTDHVSGAMCTIPCSGFEAMSAFPDMIDAFVSHPFSKKLKAAYMVSSSLFYPHNNPGRLNKQRLRLRVNDWPEVIQ